MSIVERRPASAKTHATVAKKTQRIRPFNGAIARRHDWAKEAARSTRTTMVFPANSVSHSVQIITSDQTSPMPLSTSPGTASHTTRRRSSTTVHESEVMLKKERLSVVMSVRISISPKSPATKM